MVDFTCADFRDQNLMETLGRRRAMATRRLKIKLWWMNLNYGDQDRHESHRSQAGAAD
jgi:hypothetical protein